MSIQQRHTILPQQSSCGTIEIVGPDDGDGGQEEGGISPLLILGLLFLALLALRRR